MAALAVAGYFSGAVASKIFYDSLLTQILLPVLVLYGVKFAEIWVLKSQAGESEGLRLVLEAFLPWTLATTAIFSPWVFGRLNRWTPNPSHRRSGKRY